MKKPLIIMALQSEGQGKPEALGYDVVYCGVGKVNATYTLMKTLARIGDFSKHYSHILNLGSAGSRVFKTGSLVAATDFAQRDMDATGIGFAHGQTPFDEAPLILSFPRRYETLPHGLCSSGDSFLQGACPMKGEIIDMEAYALAKVCANEGIEFAAVKYITDGSDDTAHLDWEENLVHAADAFCGLLKDKI